MSLIKCPECGQDVSDKAKVCPHCGYELPAASQNVSVPQTETETEPFVKTSTLPIAKPDTIKHNPVVENITQIWKRRSPKEYKACRDLHIIFWLIGLMGIVLGFAILIMGVAIPWNEEVIKKLTPIEVLQRYSDSKNLCFNLKKAGMSLGIIGYVCTMVVVIWKMFRRASFLKECKFDYASQPKWADIHEDIIFFSVGKNKVFFVLKEISKCISVIVFIFAISNIFSEIYIGIMEDVIAGGTGIPDLALIKTMAISALCILAVFMLPYIIYGILLKKFHWNTYINQKKKSE